MTSWFSRCINYLQGGKRNSGKDEAWKITEKTVSLNISSSRTISSDDYCKEHLIRTPEKASPSRISEETRHTSGSTTCSTLLIQDDECVICLGEFCSENPQVFTLCSCGENRSKFHYPCLVMWMERKQVCPTCDKSLFYQVRAGRRFIVIIVLIFSFSL
jgi:hypothetical protein